jgi:hypothetical protein
MNHLYFGIVSHFTQKNVDPVPVLTSIEDSVKHARSRVLKNLTKDTGQLSLVTVGDAP